MTNDEIRLKIAELKGWLHLSDYELMSKHSRWIAQGPLFGNIDPPDWTTDIRAAWELVEEMADDGDLFIESWQDGEWFIANHPLGIQPRALAHCDGRETGKRNICRAVCLAYIAWKEQGK